MTSLTQIDDDLSFEVSKMALSDTIPDLSIDDSTLDAIPDLSLDVSKMTIAETIPESSRQTAATLIQSIARMYMVGRHILLPSSLYQTKTWRKSRVWYQTGKSNECEKYQINMIERITGMPLSKTAMRVNLNSHELVEIRFPLKRLDGFEYTEDFDGIQTGFNGSKIYYNLKFVCDAGGAQTRSLREVYHFIKAQREIVVFDKEKKYFINILDGDTSHKHMSKFEKILQDPRLTDLKGRIFIGDMKQFQRFWKSHVA